MVPDSVSSPKGKLLNLRYSEFASESALTGPLPCGRVPRKRAGLFQRLMTDLLSRPLGKPYGATLRLMLERYNRFVGDVHCAVELHYEDRGILNIVLCPLKGKSALNPVGIEILGYFNWQDHLFRYVSYR